ncbi:MAG: F0F1 ATP synthase subunit epsilon [Azospirillaceae bacterium]
MADTTAFELVSPERLLASKDVAMVIVPGAEGNIGVLPRHAPLITTVRPGVIEVFESRGGEGERIFVAGGFAEVTPERCTILAEEAVPVVDIDRAKAEQALKDAREDLEDAKTDAERNAAEARIRVAQARVEAL